MTVEQDSSDRNCNAVPCIVPSEQVTSWEHWLNAALVCHSTSSSTRPQDWVHVPYFRCLNLRWASLNTANRKRKKYPSAFKQNLSSDPKAFIFFSPQCFFNKFLNNLFLLKIKFSADSLKVWYSFFLYTHPVSWKSTAKVIYLEWRGRRTCLFWFSFSIFFLIFKSSLIFPRAVPRLVNTHLSETETLTSKNQQIHSQQNFKFPSDKIPSFNSFFKS